MHPITIFSENLHFFWLIVKNHKLTLFILKKTPKKVQEIWHFFKIKISLCFWKTILSPKIMNSPCLFAKTLTSFHFKSFANWLETCKSDLYKSDTCKRLATSSLIRASFQSKISKIRPEMAKLQPIYQWEVAWLKRVSYGM